MKEIIEKAKKALQPINYRPHYPGYFVLMNGKDIGGSDYCENCIDGAVQSAKEWHYAQRADITKKHLDALATGKYSVKEVNRSRRIRLKEYPGKALFSFEGHDPDFGGGLTSPCSCDNCGEPFMCNFEPDEDEAKGLSKELRKGIDTEQYKWSLDIAFYNYDYVAPSVQKILVRIAKRVLKLKNI